MTDALLQHVRFQGRRCESRPKPPAGRSWRRAAFSDKSLDASKLDEDQRLLCDAIFSQAGLSLLDFRPAPLARRMHAVLRALRCTHSSDALNRVITDRAQARRALEVLMIGHTLAFRDESVFENLRTLVLPRLAPAPRVWSIGCSRGLELLSVCWLLELHGSPGSVLRGSDCRPVAPAADRSLAHDFAAALPWKYRRAIDPSLSAWVARQVQQIDWRHEDLFATDEQGCWDLILCRNVSIYLQPAAATRLWRTLSRALASGGYLITGKAEQPHPAAGLKRVAHCIYEREMAPPGANS